MNEWKESAHNICYKGVWEKFIQNPDLLNMLRTTKPLTIAETSNDKIWGTGVSIQDRNALSQQHWHSPGWMSSMLQNIRDEA